MISRRVCLGTQNLNEPELMKFKRHSTKQRDLRFLSCCKSIFAEAPFVQSAGSASEGALRH